MLPEHVKMASCRWLLIAMEVAATHAVLIYEDVTSRIADFMCKERGNDLARNHRAVRRPQAQWDGAKRIVIYGMGCRTTHLTSSTSHVFSCTTHQSCFQNLLLRSHFLYCCAEVFYNMDGSRPAFGVQRRISLSWHTCSDSSCIQRQLRSQHFLLQLHCYHALD